MKTILKLTIALALVYGHSQAEPETIIPEKQEEIPVAVAIVAESKEAETPPVVLPESPAPIVVLKKVMGPFELGLWVLPGIASFWFTGIHISEIQKGRKGVHFMTFLSAMCLRYSGLCLVNKISEIRLYEEYGKKIPEIWKERKPNLKYLMGLYVLHDVIVGLSVISELFPAKTVEPGLSVKMPAHLRKGGVPMRSLCRKPGEYEKLFEDSPKSKEKYRPEYYLE